jgi:hypothetical protein
MARNGAPRRTGEISEKTITELVTPDDTIKRRMKSEMILTLTPVALEHTNVPGGSPEQLGSVETDA